MAGQRVLENYLLVTRLSNLPSIEIHAPVDMERFDPDVVQPDPKIAAFDGLKILNVANINPTKGHEHFIAMASLANKSEKGLNFIIGGQVMDSQRKYFHGIESMIADKEINNITLIGSVDDVPAALKAADIFVFTSVSEASPTSVWEAMAMGKPVVTTDVGSVSQYVKDGVNGYIVGVWDSRAMADRVITLAKDPELRHEMGSRARATASEYLSLDRAARLHLEMYGKIISYK